MLRQSSSPHGSRHSSWFGSLAWLLSLAVPILILAAGLTTSAYAQGGLATVSGTVHDNTGAVVPGASVALSNEKSGELRQSTTNGSGFFSFVGVPQGSYAIFVTKKGFTTLHKTGIVVAAFANLDVPGLELKAGSVEQTVTVEGTQYYTVPLASGTKTDTITEQQIQNTPLEGRSAVELLKILPGVVNTGYNATTTGFNAGGGVGSFHVNGARDDQLAMNSNGADNIDIGCNCGAVAIPNVDMVSEVTVQTSNFSAENAKGPIVINTTTKSGGSGYHGELYYSTRQPQWDAIDASNTSGIRPNAHFYYPGGNIGGPVLIPGTNFNKHRDKMFFWFGTEYARQENAMNQMNGNIPTASMAKGDFADPADAATYAGYVANGAYSSDFVHTGLLPGEPLAEGSQDPCPDPSLVGTAPSWSVDSKGNPVTLGAPSWWSTYGGYAGACSSVGQMNPANFDKGGLAFFKQIANLSPNNVPVKNFASNYISNEIQPVNHHTYTGRVDYDFSQNTKLYVTMDHESEFSTAPYGLWWGGSNVPFPGGMVTQDFSNQLTGSLINVLSPTITNELQASLSRLNLPWSLQNPSLDSTSALGYPYQGVFENTTGLMPCMGGSNDTVALVNACGNTIPTTFAAKWLNSVRDDLSIVDGNHLIKAGVFYEHENNLQPTGDPRGNMSPATWSVPGGYNTQNAYAQLLLGIADSWGQTNAVALPSVMGNDFEGYIEDSWKTSSRLTLDLGMRVYEMPWYYSTAGNIAAFYFPQYQGPMCTNPGEYGCGGQSWANPTSGGNAPISSYSGLLSNQYSPLVSRSGFLNPGVHFAPHFGFAYDLTGHASSVLRGGFGTYYYHDNVNVFTGAAANPPSTSSVSLNTNGGQVYTLANMNLNPGDLPAAQVSNIEVHDPNDGNIPTTYSYSLTLSQKLPWQTVLEVSYVGNSSLNNVSPDTGNGDVNYNRIPQGTETAAWEQWGPGNAPQSYTAPGSTTAVNCPNSIPTNPSCVTINDNNYLPYRNYNVIDVLSHNERQNYNSMQITASRTTSRVMYSLAYTFSKALGVSGEFNGGGTPVDGFNIRGRSYGPLNYDRTNEFVASYSFLLPNVGTALGNNIIADQVLNGWQLTGITTFTSGGPLVPGMGGGANYNADYITGTPDTTTHMWVTCNPTANLQKNEYFNPACFQSPGINFNGDYQYPYIHGPQFFGSDLGIYKSFALGHAEAQKIQVRADAFNFLNHPNWSSVNSTIFFTSNGSTGATSSCNDNPACGYLQQAPAYAGLGGPGSAHTKSGGRIIEFEAKYIF